MSTKTTLYEQRDLIRGIIDRGEWKHSWHLPKDSNGYIDWFGASTSVRVRELLEEALSEGIRLAAAAEKILRTIDWNYHAEDAA